MAELGSASRAVRPAGPLGRILPGKGMQREAAAQARLRPQRQSTPLERAARVAGERAAAEASSAFASGTAPPEPSAPAELLFDGDAWRAVQSLGPPSCARTSGDPLAHVDFVNARQMLKAQQLLREQAAPTLSLAQLKDELLLAVFERERKRLTDEGHDMFHFFEPPQGPLVVGHLELPDGRRLEIQCPKHKDKNVMQVVSRQKVAGVLDLLKLLAVARSMHQEDPQQFILVAPFLRVTDMQCAAALAYPMLDMGFHAELELQGHDAEATIFSAYGAGHTGFDMPGLTMDERVRRIEVVRQNMLYNVVGDSLCLPFGGGAAREKAGEPTGVRAASFRGMAATNVLAMLQGCDVLAAIRESTPPAVFATLNTRIGNTDNVEHFFSVLKKLGGYYKGDLSQAVQTFIRADHNESVAHDASRNFLTGAKTRKGGDLYENPDYVGAEKAAQFNDGTALDPLGAPALLYKEGKRDKALRAATAEDIAVRSHHQNHGIGKAAV